MTGHILLVEDNTYARTTLASALEKAGYRVTQADSGESALHLLQTERTTDQPFDVVITDLRMYQVDGLSVLQEARNREYPPVVILLTGFGSLDNAVEAFRSGAYDYLLKPCDPSELLDCVGRAVHRHKEEQQLNSGLHLLLQGLSQLRGYTLSLPDHEPLHPPPLATSLQTRPHAAQYIHVGALCLDTFQRTVTFRGQPIHMTPTEYALLAVLAQAPGSTIPYQDIVNHTHAQEVSKNEAFLLLKQHIANLRRKLDAASIVNVRNVGYKLVVPPDVVDEYA